MRSTRRPAAPGAQAETARGFRRPRPVQGRRPAGPVLAAAVAAAVLAGAGAAAAQDENERDYLLDLREVNVFVDDLAPDAEAAGLTRDRIEAAVAARLRERGVPTGRSPLAGDLYVRVGTHRSATGLYAYFARVSLQQLVTIEGNRQRAFVDTWDLDALGAVGEANLPRVAGVVLQIVDVFIDDYFAVNDPRR